MALDAVEEEDEVIDKGGVTFVIGKKLFEKVKPVRIEYVHSGLGSGFTVDSAFTDKAKNAEAQCHNIYGSCQEFGD
jgi:Fe-S cluster assembly iron-binding protein IscA